MKKFITIILALALVLSMSVPAFAATSTGGDMDIDVYANYSGKVITPDVISADITWGQMKFTYTESGTRTWNANTHTYTDKTTTSWSSDPDQNTVTVTNHSNVGVNVGFTYTPETGSSVTGSFSYDKNAANNTVSLAAGVENKYDEADSVTVILTLGGSVPSTQTEFIKDGTITVSIAKA